MYFVRGRTISRTSFIIAACLGFFFVNGVGHLRALGGGYALNASGKIETRIPTLQEIMDIDWLSAADFEKNRTRSETRNASVFMAVIAEAKSFTFGGEILNNIVHNYVPGQIVGFEFKKGINISETIVDISMLYAGYEKHSGTTMTGFTDTYRDWWYFGSIVFYFQAYFMGRIWVTARRGDMRGFTIYAVTLYLAIHSITHYGYYWFVRSIFPIAIIWIVFHVAVGSNNTYLSARRLSRRELKSVA